MCYFLYGSLYGDVSESEYVDVNNKYGLKISLGTKHDVKSAVKAAAEFVQENFRITDWICDCDCPVGRHDPADPMIIELSNLIKDLAALSGAKQINICCNEEIRIIAPVYTFFFDNIIDKFKNIHFELL